MRRSIRWLVSIGVVVGFAVAWNIAVAFGLIPFLPYLWEVAQAMVEDASLLGDGVIATSRRALLGFVLGAGLGMTAALLMAWSRVVSGVMAPYALLAKSVPVLSLIPIFILWFGLSERARVGFVATTVFFWILVVAAEAIRNVPDIFRWSASTLGASPQALYIYVVLPAIMPGIFGGLRNAATVSFALAVAAEFLGAQSGLGFYLIKTGVNFEMEKMIGGVIVIALLAVVVDQLLVWTGRISLAWAERA